MSTHEIDPPLLPPTPPREAAARHGVRLAALIAAAVALHAVVLGGADWAWPTTEPPPLPAAAVQVRVVEAIAPVIVEAVVPVGAQAPAPVVVEAPAPVVVAPTMPARAPPALPTAPAAKAIVAPASDVRPAPAVEAPLAATPFQAARATASAPSADSVEDETIPLYRTRPAPAVTLRYELSRGALRGIGELAWRPQGDRYELTLEFRLGGLTLLSQSSTGGFDPAGLAPSRFTDQRARRGTTAANFQRTANKISYSGSSNEFALKPGAQDRLSWMLQLAAIVDAEPVLAAPGARIVMPVTGARGDAGVWVFRCIGSEAVDTRGGAINALKFVREPRQPYDTTVQVWLDPQRQHLPVRATQKSGGADEGFELRLLEAIAPN